MNTPPPLVLERREDDVAILTLNDPSTLNAASVDMVDALAAALARAETDARAVLLTGSGRGFCSGANLQSDLDPAAEDYDAGAPLESHFNPLMLQIRGLRIPLVTAVNGAAAGVGCSMALAGDIVVAGQSGYFLQAFSRIGLVPDGGSTWLLPRSVTRVRAMEMMLLGEKISAEVALEWGLVNRVVPDEALMEQALRMARTLADGPTKALGMIRRLAWHALETRFNDQLEEERRVQLDAGRTDGHREGVAAFLAKRPARFLN